MSKQKRAAEEVETSSEAVEAPSALVGADEDDQSDSWAGAWRAHLGMYHKKCIGIGRLVSSNSVVQARLATDLLHN